MCLVMPPLLRLLLPPLPRVLQEPAQAGLLGIRVQVGQVPGLARRERLGISQECGQPLAVLPALRWRLYR
jgi:hypothetical protein